MGRFVQTYDGLKGKANFHNQVATPPIRLFITHVEVEKIVGRMRPVPVENQALKTPALSVRMLLAVPWWRDPGAGAFICYADAEVY